MSKLPLVIMVCFIASFLAGGFAGALWERSTSTPKTESIETPLVAPPLVPVNGVDVKPVTQEKQPAQNRGPQGPQPNWMSELKMTPEQSEKMRSIWSQAMKESNPFADHDKQNAIRKNKDEKLRGLLTDEQKKAYEELNKDTEAKLEELNKARKAIFDEAVKQTNDMLTPEQQEIYKRNREQHKPGDWHGRGPNRGPNRPDGRRDGRDGRDGRNEPRGERPPENQNAPATPPAPSNSNNANKDQTQNQAPKPEQNRNTDPRKKPNDAAVGRLPVTVL